MLLVLVTCGLMRFCAIRYGSACKKWLKDGGTIPSDPKLEAELVAPTYAFDLRGRIKVEPKEKIQERLRPDRADALVLAVGPLWAGGQRAIAWI
jgi:hypothetical protein